MRKQPLSSPNSTAEDTGHDPGHEPEHEPGHNPALLPTEVSKSQRKREAAEITQLANTISELPQSEFDALPLEPSVRDALASLRKMSTFGARKRQLHYAGKLLRKSNPESVRAILGARQSSLRDKGDKFHALEIWRTRLIEEPGGSAFTEFIETYPAVNRQRLRQLIRNSQRETTNKQTPRSARELFKLIRETTEQNSD